MPTHMSRGKMKSLLVLSALSYLHMSELGLPTHMSP